MGIMATALRDAGLTTDKQFAAQAKAETNQHRKETKKMVGKGSIVDQCHSMREFLDYARKVLATGYTPAIMSRVIREAHQVGDRLKLNKKQRGYMHAFFAKMDSAIRGMLSTERQDFIEEQFLKADPHLVNDD